MHYDYDFMLTLFQSDTKKRIRKKIIIHFMENKKRKEFCVIESMLMLKERAKKNEMKKRPDA